MNDYIMKLEKFCEAQLKYEITGCLIRVFIDNETFYEYDTNKFKISTYERNVEIDTHIWSDKKTSDFQFATTVRSALKGGVDYSDATAIENAKSIEELSELMKLYFENDLYTIGSICEKKLSMILEDGTKYRIEYCYKGIRFLIEESDEREYAFLRFYNEVKYLEFFMDLIDKYTSLFGDEFSEDEIFSYLGY